MKDIFKKVLSIISVLVILCAVSIVSAPKSVSAVTDCVTFNTAGQTQAQLEAAAKDCPCRADLPGNATIAKGADCNKAKDSANCLFGTYTYTDPVTQAKSTKNCMFTTITNTALFLVGAISVIMLIYGGIRYTVSGGDSTAVGNAKNTILYAIVGIIVSILAFALVQFVIGQLANK